MSAAAPTCVWPVGAELGEGPVWHAAQEVFYFVDIKGRALHRCDADGGRRQSWSTPRQPGFVLPCDDGSLLCGMQGGSTRTPEVSRCCKRLKKSCPAHRSHSRSGTVWFSGGEKRRSHPLCEHIPIIFLTALTDEAAHLKGMDISHRRLCQ